MTPSAASISAEQEQATCVSLDAQGNALITGKTVEISAGKNLLLGEPTSEDGSPTRQLALEAGTTLTLQAGEEGTKIELTEEAKIIATFVKMEASDEETVTNPSLTELYDNVTAGDADARASINQGATDQLVEKHEEGRKQILKGIAKIAAVVATVAVSVALTVATGGAAGPLIATVVLGAVSVGFAASDIGEGVDNIKKSKTGSLDKGYNFIRDEVCGGNETLYNIIKVGVDIAFGIVSGKAISSISGAAKIGRFACNSKELKLFKSVLQTGGNVINAGFNQLVETGKLDPGALVMEMGIGFLQGFLGSSATNSIVGKFGLQSKTAQKLAEVLVGTVVDTGLDGLVSNLFGMEFDVWESLAMNAFANSLAAFISDPVDAVTGTYLLQTTDFILASVPMSLKVDRTYRSTSGRSSVFGWGWSLPYASRIYCDTQDMEHIRVHLETITGHSLCFEYQDGIWVNQCKGTSRFQLAVKEETFLLTDVVEHTLCVYDSQGQLTYVEYPNHQRLEFAYGEEGLRRRESQGALRCYQVSRAYSQRLEPPVLWVAATQIYSII